MPISITITEGVLPKGSEKQVVSKITDAFLNHHGLLGNKVITRNITAQFLWLPRNQSFQGGEEFSGAWVEAKTPAFAFTDREVQKKFTAEAIQIIHDLSGGKQPKDHIYINVVHAVDGAWSFEGVAMTNTEIGEAISKE